MVIQFGACNTKKANMGCKTLLRWNLWKRSWVRDLRHAIFQRKPWILGGTIGYHMEWWKGGDGGEDKTGKKEETENKPLEDGDQSMVSGLEWCKRRGFNRVRRKRAHQFLNHGDYA